MRLRYIAKGLGCPSKPSRMTASKLLAKYRIKDRQYANTILTAIVALEEDEVLAKLKEAEKQGKRLQLTYPIDPDAGPSEPNGVVMA